MFLLCATMLSIAGLPRGVFAESAGDYTLIANTTTVQQGKEIAIIASGKMVDMYAFDAEFTYDALKLEFVKAESMLRDGFSFVIKNEGGKLLLAYTKSMNQGPENTSKELYKLTFKSKANVTGEAIVKWDTWKTVNGSDTSTTHAIGKTTSVQIQAGDGSVISNPPTSQPPTPIPPLSAFDGSKLSITPTLSGTMAKTELSQELLQQLLSKAVNDGKGLQRSIIDLKTTTGAEGYTQGLPAVFFKNGNGERELEIQTAIGSISLPNDMFKEKQIAGASKVEISIKVADTSLLKPELKQKIGNKPVLDLSVWVDGSKVQWKNNQAPVTVTIPYQSTPDELKNPTHIAIWYLDGEGKVTKIPSGRYDAVTGTVTFKTTHFSTYAVAYERKSFSDLDHFDWAKDAIETLVSKGIVNGTSEETFAPDHHITRADFVSLLIRTLGLEADFQSNFEDVTSDDYYYEEIGIAKQLGIANGAGANQFQPKQTITRQDMMVLAARAMRAAVVPLFAASLKDLSTYSDSGHVSEYALDSVATLVKAGIVQGDGVHLWPAAPTSRAETAVLVYRLYSRL
ncbi:S-layer homology domain-containing protein [Paenibacillus roseipurpureus]|uniref:S-layer homology domain-containing protein n=1 Tax=Paenibacillus roseopurpureus TaxID=2918901 RepID=A0AA96LU03_9BACL|nr:S-layer homology domain-containing protein [Paenibacillus sp. MBLB1832]WNR46018.1 S-layer homology domain-containing protein [Paenibacillus sp. MBLB1832]